MRFYSPNISSGRTLDEGVLRGIDISFKSGVLANSRNDSYNRRARNSTRQSTVMRKSHESHELANERARIDAEIQELQDAQKRGSEQLKALKAQKSAARKTPKTSKSTAGSRSAIVSTSSSGHVKTRLIGITLSFYLTTILIRFQRLIRVRCRPQIRC